MLTNKKAQIETIGLVVIIILLVTIGFIFLSFASKTPNKEQKDYQMQALANALLKTQTSIENKDMKTLIYDSYSQKNYQELSKELEQILKTQLPEKYSITISSESSQVFNLAQYEKCTGIVESRQFTKNRISFKFSLTKCS